MNAERKSLRIVSKFVVIGKERMNKNNETGGPKKIFIKEIENE